MTVESKWQQPVVVRMNSRSLLYTVMYEGG